MIELHTYDTGNGQRPRIMLEEVGLPYVLRFVDLRVGEQRSPEYLALNPTGRIPTLIDPDGPGGTRVIVTQSMGALYYLAEKTGKLLPADPAGKAAVRDAMFMAATDIQQSINAGAYLSMFGPVKMPEAGKALFDRAGESCRHLEDWMADGRPWLAGADYSIADIAAFTVVMTLKTMGGTMPDLPRVERWYGAMLERPAVQRGIAKMAP